MLFKSKFAKLEAFAAAKPEERTPDMLAAAQQEQDQQNTGVILVPKSEEIGTAADLQAHIEALETRATQAEAATAKVTKEMEELRGTRVLPTQKVTADGDKGGDDGPETAEQKEEREQKARVMEMAHYQRALSILNN